MNQTKAARMHPGAFRSCLIPFTDQILDWWYDDLLTAAEIQRRLKAEGLEVARTTVMRFIKVREQRAAKRKRPAALRKKNTISAEQPVIPPPFQTQSTDKKYSSCTTDKTAGWKSALSNTEKHIYTGTR